MTESNFQCHFLYKIFKIDGNVCYMTHLFQSKDFHIPKKQIRMKYIYCLFRMIISKIQQLSMLQIERLRIPFSEKEEQLLASIPSHVNKFILVFC
jgi:hypothetical protein